METCVRTPAQPSLAVSIANASQPTHPSACAFLVSLEMVLTDVWTWMSARTTRVVLARFASTRLVPSSANVLLGLREMLSLALALDQSA